MYKTNQESSSSGVYDGAWKNDNFLGKTDIIWFINESFEEYQGQWSHGFRNGHGVVKKVVQGTLTCLLTHSRSLSCYCRDRWSCIMEASRRTIITDMELRGTRMAV